MFYKIKRFYRLYISINSLKTFLKRYYFKYKTFEDAVTVIITSSGRKEYLYETLESLKNSIVSDRKIYWHIIDDNPSSEETQNYIQSLDFNCILFNKKNRGLGYSLNRIYRTIHTKYIFHCEDDWLFLRSLNLDEMINALNKSKNEEQLILYRLQPYKFKPIKLSNEFYNERYYSFNPHFVKTELVSQLLPFANENTERTISDKARRNNIRSRIYNYQKDPYVSHIGIKKDIKKY